VGQTVSHLAVDGSRVDITSENDLSYPFTSKVVVPIDGLRLGFVSGGVTHGEAISRDGEFTLTGIKFEEEYAFSGGTLRLGQGKQIVGPEVDIHMEPGADGMSAPAPVRLGVWEGTAYSIYSFLYGRTYELLRHNFEQFEITETSEGVSMSPVGSSVGPYETTRMLKAIPGLGLTVIENVAKSRRVPAHPGSPAAGGDLYVKHEEDDHHGPTFLLVSDSAATTIIPDGPPANPIEEQVLVESVSNLRVNWKPGH
jgi:hypothetical protein